MSTSDSNAPAVEVAGEVSETSEDLNAKIEQELGLPPAEATNEGTEEAPAEEEAEPGEGEQAGEADAGTPAEEPAEEPEPEEEPEEEAEPEPATPSDEELFIEVEDSEGVTHKISKIEDLPEDFTPKNNRQILEIVSKLGKLDAEREQNEALRAENEEKAAVAETQQRQFAAWDTEVTELAKTKRIDSSDTERIDKVFGLMVEINNGRREANNPNLITSFEDALDKFEAREAAEKADTARKNDNDRAKRKASLIGASSAAAGSDYVYRAGSARNIDDIPVEI